MNNQKREILSYRSLAEKASRHENMLVKSVDKHKHTEIVNPVVLHTWHLCFDPHVSSDTFTKYFGSNEHCKSPYHNIICIAIPTFVFFTEDTYECMYH